MLAGAALFALALGVPFAAVRLSVLDQADAPSERQALLMREVAQLVIPRTDTPGAGDVAVGAFVILALAHGLEGTRDPGAGKAFAGTGPLPLRGDGSLRYLEWLERTLDRRANGDFLRLSPAGRASVLAALDAEAYAEGAQESPWKRIKALVLLGYYTSESGGSQELRYELVPGRWDPKVPLSPGDRAWSSDWTAVDFG